MSTRGGQRGDAARCSRRHGACNGRGSRPQLALSVDEGFLFLTSQGEPVSVMRASHLVRGYVIASDIRYIQHLLGHAELSTTQVYTQVSVHKLMEVHARTHPGARLAPAREDDRVREDVGIDEGLMREELISLLAAEAEDEREELGDGVS